MGRLNKILFSSRQLFKDTRNKIEHGIKSLEDIIEENLKIVKYIIPSALMATLSSNTYGRIGYYGSQAFIYSRMAKENVADAGHLMYGKTPLMVGAITGAAGFIMGILVGDISGLYNLFHHNNDIGIPQLSHNDTNPSSVTNYNNSTVYNNDNITINNNITTCNSSSATNYNNSTISKLENEINSLQNLLKEDNQTISNLEDKLQNDTNIINIYQNQLNQYNQTISNLRDQVQNLQNSQALEKILFGNSSKDISIIQVNSVNINNGTAYIQGVSYPSGKEVTLEIPISYAENNGVNIQNLYNASQQNNWNTYIALDRADLQYLTLNNQNSTTVIDILPNKPLNIGEYATPVNASALYNVLNHLTKYNMVIQDSIPVYNNHDALWGYKLNSNSSVVIDFSNNYQYNLAEKMINIADQIINSPNNQNPTHSGIIDTYSIFSGTISGYGGYAQYNVGNIYPLIVLKPQQGNTIPDAVSS